MSEKSSSIKITYFELLAKLQPLLSRLQSPDPDNEFFKSNKFFRISNQILLILLWARWIPQSDKDIKGFFDPFPIKEDKEWDKILIKIKQTLLKISPNDKENFGELFTSGLISTCQTEDVDIIEIIRSKLYDCAKEIYNKNQREINSISHALKEIRFIEAKNINEILITNPNRLIFHETFWNSILTNQNAKDIIFNGEERECIPFLKGKYNITTEIPIEPFELGLIGLSKNPIFPKIISRSELTKDKHIKKKLSILTMLNDSFYNYMPDDVNKILSEEISNRNTIFFYKIIELLILRNSSLTETSFILTHNKVGYGTYHERIRSKLIDDNILDAVINIPGGVATNSKEKILLLILKSNREKNKDIYFGKYDKLGLLGFSEHDFYETNISKDKKEYIRKKILDFLDKHINKRDSSSRFSTLKSLDIIKENRYIIDPDRYIATNRDIIVLNYLADKPNVFLDDLVEIKRPLSTVKKLSSLSIGGKDINEIQTSNINDAGFINVDELNSVKISEDDFNKSKHHLLKDNDILISVKSVIGIIAYIKDLKGLTIPSQAFCILRLKDNSPINSINLFQYLRSNLGKYMIKTRIQNPRTPFLSMKELKSLSIIIPNRNQSKKSEDIFKKSIFKSETINNTILELQEMESAGWLTEIPKEFLD